ncbi:hypothetical protein UFOVP244_83 [uncultured Caudovirales phage]|uniref:Uncharacterized protein n=1 Tax=uncultured Caudovirales phage TaxID=2100421 RepID=A0A6J7WTN3_9CAUD|nr:hypothetical protein UFOVP244_83 [uncultured Caudovirales phage]
MVVRIQPFETVVLCSPDGDSVELTYEEIEKALLKRTPRKYRESSAGAKMSRVIALRVNAIEKGTWSTGATIDRSKMFSELVDEMASTSLDVLNDLTPKAVALLRRLASNEAISETDSETVQRLISLAEGRSIVRTTENAEEAS